MGKMNAKMAAILLELSEIASVSAG